VGKPTIAVMQFSSSCNKLATHQNSPRL